MTVRIRLRRGTASGWASTNPILATGELGYESDTGKAKVGDGSTAWNSLGYIVQWSTITGKPAVIAAGATAAEARTAISAEFTDNKNAANGYCGLDASGKVAAAQLPSYVDDIEEYATPISFPYVGESGKIYVAQSDGKVYRYTGSAYVEISPSPGSTDSVAEGATNLYYTNARADARIANAVGVSVQAYDADLDSFAGKSAPTGDVVGTTDTQTLSSKTIQNYTESTVAIGTVGTGTTALSINNGTVLTATLTANQATTFTMPTVQTGKSFILMLRQAATTGNGTATFTGVKWPYNGTAPVITATANRMDILTFFCDGTNWYGSTAQNYVL